ncbi:MAG TPA: hypothetical protein VJB59_16290 [Bdellovibrionota bacterium]|nr:hypothetical protein [Bdellovibrionota bacterium]
MNLLQKYLDDLRFIIGVLFMIFALILVVLGITEPVVPGRLNLNLYTGLFMAVFSGGMLFFSVRDQMKAEEGPKKTKASVAL